jgi:hypothetical protein
MAKESKAKQSELFRRWLAGEYLKQQAITVGPPSLGAVVSSGGKVPNIDEDEQGRLVRVPTAKAVDWLVSKGLDPTESLSHAVAAGWLNPVCSTIENPLGKRWGFRFISAKVLGAKPSTKSVGRNRETEPEQWERLNTLWQAFLKECDENAAKKLGGQRKRSIEHFVYWAKLQGHEYEVAAVRKIRKAEREYNSKQRRN